MSGFAAWRDRRVFITGHTGFKGGWLVHWLHALGAQVYGYALPPSTTPGSKPSWFGYPVTIKPEANLRRVDLLTHLNEKRIGTRLLFAGNFTRHPCMQGRNMRTPAPLANTDVVMHNTFWIGLYPGLSEEQLAFAAQTICNFVGGGF